MFSDTIIQPEAHLRTIFEPVKESVEKSVKKFAKKSVENLPEFLPVPYTIDHPLPDLIRQFNDFMSGITVVFAHWAENGELYPLIPFPFANAFQCRCSCNHVCFRLFCLN